MYRAVDKASNTVDFQLRACRDKAAARRHLERSIARNGEPETVTIDKSDANLAGLEAINGERDTPIKIRQTKRLNSIVERDNRAVKRNALPMPGSRNFHCAHIQLSGIEFMRMIAKGQINDGDIQMSAAEQLYYSLAA